MQSLLFLQEIAVAFFVFSNKIYAKWLQNYIWSTDERNYIHQSEMEDEEKSKKAAPEKLAEYAEELKIAVN